MTKPDPMEAMIRDALNELCIPFVEPSLADLDFYLPTAGVHIEVKRFHSDRINEQMSRVQNVIVLQGVVAVRWFCANLGYNGG